MKLKTQEFYYKFNKLNAWFILNVVLFNVLVYWGIVWSMSCFLVANTSANRCLCYFLGRLEL